MSGLKEANVLALIYALIHTPHLTTHFDHITVAQEEIDYLEALLPANFEPLPMATLDPRTSRSLGSNYFEVRDLSLIDRLTDLYITNLNVCDPFELLDYF